MYRWLWHTGSWANRLEYYSLNASNRAPVALNVFIENAAFDVTVLFPRRKLHFEFFQQSEYCWFWKQWNTWNQLLHSPRYFCDFFPPLIQCSTVKPFCVAHYFIIMTRTNNNDWLHNKNCVNTVLHIYGQQKFTPTACIVQHRTFWNRPLLKFCLCIWISIQVKPC